MAREKGLSAFSANFEAQIAAPIDARMIVATRADLILATTWEASDELVYTYKGMIVSVHSDSTPANNGLYILTDEDYTNIDNWVKVQGNGGSVDWGNIGGTLSDQTDLQNELNAKQNTLVFDEDLGYLLS